MNIKLTTYFIRGGSHRQENLIHAFIFQFLKLLGRLLQNFAIKEVGIFYQRLI